MRKHPVIKLALLSASIGFILGVIAVYASLQLIASGFAQASIFPAASRLEDGNHVEALELLHDARSRLPESVDSLYLLTKVYIELGCTDIAQRYLVELHHVLEQGHSSNYITDDDIAELEQQLASPNIM